MGGLTEPQPEVCLVNICFYKMSNYTPHHDGVDKDRRIKSSLSYLKDRQTMH